MLCDDHTLLLEGLTALMEREPGWRVVAQTSDGAEAVRLAGELTPDVALIDVAMPGMNGMETAAGIRMASPATRIVALSMYADDHYLQRMLAAGARAYVLKGEASTDLFNAIRAVLQGETFVSPSLSQDGRRAVQRAAEVDQACLSDREREVLRRLAQGQRNKEIAIHLGISDRTVETYRNRLMHKLKVNNLADLVRFAIQAGIAPRE
ncbi:MAG: response regulator transcription factor [Chromatiaceae bacterium]|nr:response regulator transcription factor [Candidatus Thioaporhodococcus sediminis]